MVSVVTQSAFGWLHPRLQQVGIFLLRTHTAMCSVRKWCSCRDKTDAYTTFFAVALATGGLSGASAPNTSSATFSISSVSDTAGTG